MCHPMYKRLQRVEKKMHFTISLQCGYENKPIVWRHEKVKKTSMFSLSKKD